MRAELSICPLTATETQLDHLCRYEPPLGKPGAVMDALVGHRIAEASVHRLQQDIAGNLRVTLGKARSRATSSRASNSPSPRR